MPSKRYYAAIEMMNKTYRKARPSLLRKCQTPLDAIVLPDEVKAVIEDAHALAKIESVMNYPNTLDDAEK